VSLLPARVHVCLLANFGQAQNVQFLTADGRPIQLQRDRLAKIVLAFCHSPTMPAFELRLLYKGLIFILIAKMKTLRHYIAQVLRV